jgi:putative FmdB family regulatory protein
LPRYDYKCDSCNETYELQQSFSAESSHVCEECGKGTATRVLSVPTVVFKGSGFYVNDKGGKSTTLSDEPTVPDSVKSDSEPKSSSKSDSKSKSSSKSSDAAAS